MRSGWPTITRHYVTWMARDRDMTSSMSRGDADNAVGGNRGTVWENTG